MRTFLQLKDAMLLCAASAQTAEPVNADARSRCFVAQLCGAMRSLNEPDIEQALWALLGHDEDLAPDNKGIFVAGTPAPGSVSSAPFTEVSAEEVGAGVPSGGVCDKEVAQSACLLDRNVEREPPETAVPKP